MRVSTTAPPVGYAMASRRPTRKGIEVRLPGRKHPLRIEHVVFDFNGTLALDGRLVRGVAPRLRKLASLCNVVVMTADTFGTVRGALAGLPFATHIVRNGPEKRRLVESLGRERVAAVGNGTNDVPMLKAAALGIVVMGDEGASGEAMRVGRIVARDINVAIDMLLRPPRLVATLRR
jgi:soluble P-type ATPase